MNQGEVIEQVKKNQPAPQKPESLSVADISKITNLFSILIKIDQRMKGNHYETGNN